jgi:hypothetical protein
MAVMNLKNGWGCEGQKKKAADGALQWPPMTLRYCICSHSQHSVIEMIVREKQKERFSWHQSCKLLSLYHLIAPQYCVIQDIPIEVTTV